MSNSQALPNNGGLISKTEDILATYTYEELSMEFKRLYPVISKAFQLISLMYNRLTIKDGLSHKEASSKIFEDHKHLHGFSQRNIRRSLMSIDNPNIPHRTGRKIRPTWPNSVDSRASFDINDRDNAILSSKSLPADQNHELETDLTRKTECSNCSVLLQQTQKLEKEKSKIAEGYEQALQIIKEQEKRISGIPDAETFNNQLPANNDSTKVLEQEIALLYDPLQQAMASTFKLKENKIWLTIRFNKITANIVAVYTGRKSDVAYSSTSILSSRG
jgi:hypothetical protein